MAEVVMILFLCAISVLATTSLVAERIEEGPKAVEKWFQTFPGRTQKLTNLRFYFQDIVSGINPTARLVVKANGTSVAPFGSIMAIDDKLTVGPEVNSTEVGRAQGIYTFSQLDGQAVEMSMTLAFTSGKYNGSTLSLLGHNVLLSKYKEMPILGGTGVFRLARGIATAQTHSVDFTTFDATLQYDVTIIHY